MAARFTIIDAAKSDLADVRSYTRREHGDDQAKVYMAALREGFKTLRANSEIGINIDHIRKNYRCFQVKHHRIIYRLKDDAILVIAVLHERQLPLRHIAQRQLD